MCIQMFAWLKMSRRLVELGQKQSPKVMKRTIIIEAVEELRYVFSLLAFVRLYQ